MTKLEEYKKINKELGFMAHAINLMYWDMQTIAPEGGKERLSDSITYFSTEIFKRSTSDTSYTAIYHAWTNLLHPYQQFLQATLLSEDH